MIIIYRLLKQSRILIFEPDGLVNPSPDTRMTNNVTRQLRVKPPKDREHKGIKTNIRIKAQKYVSRMQIIHDADFGGIERLRVPHAILFFVTTQKRFFLLDTSTAIQ
ncbi:uncharacterized protein LOC112494557 [Cephus cinctus]|uniref:Uncharacterized protein LOC112494557 n=1 Tax=Cephus cinctus TaxID=211228 RepID=A0AAJ7RJQ6_CEPCN|nr:uncharacterized protein LOC112494557 [Cephus cinctus]